MTRRPLLTTSEVADLCGVTEETVRFWYRKGQIPVIHLPGGLKRFRPEDVDALLTPTAPTEPAA